MARLDQDREKRLEPERLSKAVDAVTALGFEIVVETNKMICFLFNGNVITYYPYSGWHTGKGIKDGRGWKNLEKQLK